MVDAWWFWEEDITDSSHERLVAVIGKGEY